MRPCVAAHPGPVQRHRPPGRAGRPAVPTHPSRLCQFGQAEPIQPTRPPLCAVLPVAERRCRHPRHGPTAGHLHCPPGRAFRSAAPPPFSRFTTIIPREFSVIAALVTCAVGTAMFAGATFVTSHSLFTDKFTQVCTN
uniref:Uncharacterized protein n=1 Tax=Setaria viridis TaxID=4556 RepID=A0A4U6VLB6_SETVI|nr:hypothetical protein SEVIR_3G368100v2 [Setaria viridis]